MGPYRGPAPAVRRPRGGRADRGGRLTEVDTPHGPARVEVERAPEERGLLALGHGAGGGTGAKDLQRAKAAALGAGWSVALVEQPYRVAGRRSPAPAAQLDAAWRAVMAHLQAARIVTGGRSSGARVACRTAADVGAIGVLCLAFPVHPPGRPEKSRLDELDAVTVPTLVIQGESDPFGMPPPGPRRTVVHVRGNHSLTGDLHTLTTEIGRWLVSLEGAT